MQALDQRLVFVVGVAEEDSHARAWRGASGRAKQLQFYVDWTPETPQHGAAAMDSRD